mmetsp:Transcript_27587/g.61618  ORF Transcript_27587/g.61618 Transcript_27587/m.61618 type:complete len:121 (+) Transcript_27587:2-364(+)
MHYASWGGSLNTCVFLFKHGCEADLKVRASNGMLPADYALHYGHIRLMRWFESLKNGEDWTKDTPGQIPQERALCPPPGYGKKKRHVETDEEREAREKLETKRLAMEEAGLDADSFAGFS